MPLILFPLLGLVMYKGLRYATYRLGRDIHELGFDNAPAGFATRWFFPGGNNRYVRVLRYGYTASDGSPYWEVQFTDGKKALASQTELSPEPTLRGTATH